MPRQAGPPYMKGVFNGYIYYQTMYGWFFRKLTKPGTAVLKGPGFAGVRKSNKQFGLASKTGKLIRAAFAAYTDGATSSDMHTRLVSAIKQQLAGDDIAATDKPVLRQPDLGILKDFPWDASRPLPKAILSSCSIQVDREHGSFEVIVSSLSPALLKHRAKFATHLRVQAVLAGIDIEAEAFETVPDETGLLCTHLSTGDFILSGRLPEMHRGYVLLLCLGIAYYEVTNGVAYPLKEGRAFGIVGV